MTARTASTSSDSARSLRTYPCAPAARLCERIPLGLHRQYQDRAPRRGLAELRNCRERRFAGHVQVEHDDPWLIHARESEGAVHVARLSDHRQVWLELQDALEATSDQRMVVGEHNPDPVRSRLDRIRHSPTLLPCGDRVRMRGKPQRA